MARCLTGGRRFICVVAIGSVIRGISLARFNRRAACLIIVRNQDFDHGKVAAGVFASIDAGLGVKLEVAHELGVPTIQLHAPAKSTRTPQRARDFLDRLGAMQIRITAVFGGFEGESYADIPTVTRTVGLVPPETRAERTREMKEIADFARLLGVDVVGLHLGFVPHDHADDLYRQVITVTRDLCDHCKSQGQAVHLETGQEPADTLVQFIGDVERDNLFINFDPANMILYGSGEPIEALEKVGRWVKSVHCKDGTWPNGRARSGAPKWRWATATSEWNAICARSTKSVIGVRSPSSARFPKTPSVKKSKSVAP